MRLWYLKSDFPEATSIQQDPLTHHPPFWDILLHRNLKFMKRFCSLHCGGLNYCSGSLLQGGQVQILQPPRTVLTTTIGEENNLSGTDQTSLLYVIQGLCLDDKQSSKRRKKEMSEILWEYLGKNQCSQQAKPVRDGAAVQTTKLFRNPSVKRWLREITY